MSNSKRALLTSKYQLIENIRSLNLLFPQAMISFVISNAAILSTLIMRIWSDTLPVPIFFTIYNINVVIMSVYWVFRSTWFKAKYNRINDSTNVMNVKVTTVKTALGKTVKVQQTIEEYFKDLKIVWK